MEIRFNYNNPAQVIRADFVAGDYRTLMLKTRKFEVYQDRQDDLDDPLVPFTMVQKYNGNLCSADLTEHTSLEEKFAEVTGRLLDECGFKAVMTFVNSKVLHDYNLKFYKIYQQARPDIALFENEKALELMRKWNPRFRQMYHQRGYDYIMFMTRYDDISAYEKDWINPSKNIK